MNLKNRKVAPDGASASADVAALVVELQAVKMLLILQALAMGYKQKHLASALGVSEATLSRMMPKGLPKDLGATSQAGA